MNNQCYLKLFIGTVKYAYKNNIKKIDRKLWQGNDNELNLLKRMIFFHEIVVDKDFYDDINVFLNNFEEELSKFPIKYLNYIDIISNGIVFTPIYLANEVVERCKKYITDCQVKLAGDVSSGMGAFIYALNKCLPRINTISFENNKLLFDLSNQLFGSKKNILLNKNTLTLEKKFNEKYDLIVGNPPYVRLQNINDKTRKYIEADDKYRKFLFGSYDLSIAFIVKIIDLLKENGVAGLVLSRNIITSSYGKKICEYLFLNTQILEIIDFGDNQMFQDKTTYTLVIIFRKKSNIGLYEFYHSKIPTQKHITTADLTDLIKENQEQYMSEVLKKYPWNFTKEKEKIVLEKIMDNGKKLTKEFGIIQGFRTGDNKAFFVENNGRFIRPYVDGKCIKRGYIFKTKKIIWPYVKEKDDYKLIKEKEFLEKNKKAYDHITHMKKKIKNGEKIYAYSRPQNLYAMDSKKIFVKEMMPRAEFAADIIGNICFGSGYALLPKNNISDKEIKVWAFILSTEVMEYQYRLLGNKLHSGWFRMYKEHLARISLPDINVLEENELLSIIDVLEKNVLDSSAWNMLNKYIGRKFLLNDSELQYIEKYVGMFYRFSMPEKEKRNKIEMENKNSKYEDNIEETAYPELSIEERALYYPVELTEYNKLHVYDNQYKTLVTFQNDKNAPVQGWYKYTQGYSGLLVSKLLEELDVKKSEIIFDPFCGSGTTLLTALDNGISCIGCDVSPLSCWISRIKTHKWDDKNAKKISKILRTLECDYEYDFQGLQFKKFFEKAFYPEILAQTIHIRNWISLTDLEEIEKDFLRMALISVQEEISFIRKHGSHYRFLNEYSHVGVNKLNIKIVDETCDITLIFKDKVNDMLNDIMMIKSENAAKVSILRADILELNEKIKANVVITSPPYLNRNNYFSQQKIELSLLNLIDSPEEYRELVKQSFCSHIEAHLPEEPISRIVEVNKIIEALTKRESNNAKIPHMIAGYFNDMDSFFKKLPHMLSHGARVAFVVANCRWNGVVIPVDHLVCRIAEQYGFETEKIIVARLKGNSPQQMQKYGKIPVRESIVCLKLSETL